MGKGGWQSTVSNTNRSNSPMVTTQSKPKQPRKTSTADFEQQYLQQIQQNRLPNVGSPQVIEIPDEDQSLLLDSNKHKNKTNKQSSSGANPGSRVSNIGIQYPGGPPVPTTPIYLPEGISINKIPKNLSSASKPPPTTMTSSATITPVVNRNISESNLTRKVSSGSLSEYKIGTTSSLNRPGLTINKVTNQSRPSVNSSMHKKVSNIPISATKQLQSSSQPRISVIQPSSSSSSGPIPIRLTKAVTPTNSMTITPIVTTNTGLKRKQPPTNDLQPSKISRTTSTNVSIFPKK